MPSRAFLSFSREFVACDQTTFVRSFANSGQYSGTSIERNRNIMIHNCQEDFLIREITGKSLSIRQYSKSKATRTEASNSYYYKVRVTVMTLLKMYCIDVIWNPLLNRTQPPKKFLCIFYVVIGGQKPILKKRTLGFK